MSEPFLSQLNPVRLKEPAAPSTPHPNEPGFNVPTQTSSYAASKSTSAVPVQVTIPGFTPQPTETRRPHLNVQRSVSLGITREPVESNFWTSRIDPKSGKPFFYNSKSKTSVWTLPTGVKAAPLVLQGEEEPQARQSIGSTGPFVGVKTSPYGQPYMPTPVPNPHLPNQNAFPNMGYQAGPRFSDPMPFGMQYATQTRRPPHPPQKYPRPAFGAGAGVGYYPGDPDWGSPAPGPFDPIGPIAATRPRLVFNPRTQRFTRIPQQLARIPQRFTRIPQQFGRGASAGYYPADPDWGGPIGPIDPIGPIASVPQAAFDPRLRLPVRVPRNVLGQKNVTQTAFDIRKIASQGGLSSLIDKRTAGVFAVRSHENNLRGTKGPVLSGRLIKYSPIVSAIKVQLIPGLFQLNFAAFIPQGCWMLRYYPVGYNSNATVSIHLHGTMRVEHLSLLSIKMSGDLYTHYKINLPWLHSGSSEPDPSKGIPIFSRGSYNSYLRVTKASISGANTLNLEMERHSLDSSNNWIVDGGYSATMQRQTLPATSKYPHKNRYFVGDVYQGGACVATLKMGWVHEKFRKITLELDSVTASPIPVNNADGFTWDQMFNNLGYKAKVVCSDTSISETSGNSWNSSELHAAMLANREKDDLDAEWRYHIFFVRNLDMTDRGVMYDVSGDEEREGAATASHWDVPNTTSWGVCAGKKFHLTDGYIRTAMHELGHAFNLQHNSSNTHFMRVTPSIVSAGTTSNPFPENIKWSFSPADTNRLRHWPDPVVRPGALGWAPSTYAAIPISDEDDPYMLPSPHLELDISPLRATVPLGAPVRFNVRCTNTSDQDVPGPASLSLGNPNFRGEVSSMSSPNDSGQTFASIFKCNDGNHETPMPYAPGASRTSSITLIRGAEGPLFSTPGMHRVSVELSWVLNNNNNNNSSSEDESETPCPAIRFVLKSECNVMISPPRSPAEAQQALTVLSAKDLLPAFVFGTPLAKLNPATRRALQTAMNAPALRSHFSVLRSRWYRASRAAARGEPIPQLEPEIVLTDAERVKIAQLTRL